MSDYVLTLQRLFDVLTRYRAPTEFVKGWIGSDPFNAISQPNGDMYGLSSIEFAEYIIALLSPKIPLYSTYITNRFIKKALFGVPSTYVKATKEITDDRKWFVYINGLMTNGRICDNNVRCIEEELGRHGCVNAVANETDSVYADFLKSVPFYSGSGLTDATVLVATVLLEKILDPEVDNCVVIAHSHGCQVMGLVLNTIWKLNIEYETKRDFMRKLEVYNFATPTLYYNYVVDELPYIEHIANEYDFVANTSGIGLYDTTRVSTHDGKIVIREGAYGHLFNIHYMAGFKDNFPESQLINHMK
jgi:hypothetical protein